ncbi:hypothetical protein MPTK1_4g18730 [Marchantia polymorpha subsp. ruderalis]|uniref:F-box domain-containing protein n=2 Tax=Marchantia polymorpha TaxID=3197 RepID=A0AAF6BBC9_MARPO|nr:hypothetical protein MARPO_0041s0155 [Marchantia polymorpha]BBN09313.1 hypothetical protein Mp_4g18730 [Marchantia polymorpha subsp. ruderalis]|eukprot:PTQ40304.1 hypothetical protein MARPO_0041s0155 [Marchantia polymorpha]
MLLPSELLQIADRHIHHPLNFFVAMVLETEESRPGDPWETLSIEFLIKILRDHGLPVSTLAACRSVCKKWMEIVDGPDLRSKIWNKHVIVYCDTFTDSKAFFCCSDQWITRNITFESNRLIAAHGGLLCFDNHLSTEYVLYNPVPDKFLTLNVPHEIDGKPAVIDGMMECVVVGLFVDRSTNHFKLLLGGVLLPDERRSLIYDSTTGTWSWLAHPFPANMELGWQGGKCVACGGCLYWLVWNRRDHMKALLIFHLQEEKWRALLEKVEEDKPGSLQIAAYEGHVCLFAMDWFPLDGSFDRRSYGGAFLQHPMVREMDGALIERTRELWEGEEGRPFILYAAGSSDAFFIFNREYNELVVAKYSAGFGLLFFLPDPPFRDVHDFRFWRILLQTLQDPWCAIIPTPGVCAEHEWITQPRREPQEEVLEAPRGDAAPEAQAGGEEVQEGSGNE